MAMRDCVRFICCLYLPPEQSLRARAVDRRYGDSKPGSIVGVDYYGEYQKEVNVIQGPRKSSLMIAPTPRPIDPNGLSISRSTPLEKARELSALIAPANQRPPVITMPVKLHTRLSNSPKACFDTNRFS
jgi:hypothetical protein